MRIIRVQHKGTVFYASLLEGAVQCLHKQLGFTDPIPLTEVSILPLVAPSKIICVELNYREHALEMDMPMPTWPSFFLKPPSSLVGNGQPIILPADVGRVDGQAELALVMGQTCRNVAPEAVQPFLFGYTCANDISARDMQKNDPFMGHCKAYDTFCPVGPWIETDVKDPDNLAIRCVLNGEVRQHGTTADMIFHPLELVSYLSHIMTLLPGDLILTGTPAGLPQLEPGDMVQVEIEEVGVLFNPVEEPRPEDSIMQ